MGVRGIARWSNAPAEGFQQITNRLQKVHSARPHASTPWRAEIRTIKRDHIPSDPSERSMWEFSLGGDLLVVIEDSSAPVRQDFYAELEALRARNEERMAQQTTDPLELEPRTPVHFRHTILGLQPPLLETILFQLSGAWSVQNRRQVTGPGLGGGRQGGVMHKLRVEGSAWSVGQDWLVRIGKVMAMGDQFRGIIMEVEYLPVAVLPTDGGRAFMDEFTVSLLPPLPPTALFNSVLISDDEWANICGIPVSEEKDGKALDDVYAYGDEETMRGISGGSERHDLNDFRRAGYMMIQVLKNENLL